MTLTFQNLVTRRLWYNCTCSCIFYVHCSRSLFFCFFSKSANTELAFCKLNTCYVIMTMLDGILDFLKEIFLFRPDGSIFSCTCAGVQGSLATLFTMPLFLLFNYISMNKRIILIYYTARFTKRIVLSWFLRSLWMIVYDDFIYLILSQINYCMG